MAAQGRGATQGVRHRGRAGEGRATKAGYEALAHLRVKLRWDAMAAMRGRLAGGESSSPEE